MDFLSHLRAWVSIFGLVPLLCVSRSSASDILQDGVCLAEDSEALQVFKSVVWAPIHKKKKTSRKTFRKTS